MGSNPTPGTRSAHQHLCPKGHVGSNPTPGTDRSPAHVPEGHVGGFIPPVTEHVSIEVSHVTPERHLPGGARRTGPGLTPGAGGKDVSVQKIMWRVIALGAGTAAAARYGRSPPRRGGRPVTRTRRPTPRRAVCAGVTPHLGDLGGGRRGGGRVVAERGAATAWEAATGSPPPGLET